MPEYQLEPKQLAAYPRYRIYRSFVQALIRDRAIRVGKGCGLYHYIVLCTHANFRTSYERIKSHCYLVKPGEWVCTITELADWFRVQTQRTVVAVLDEMVQSGLLSYKIHAGRLVHYRIHDWSKHNRVLEYNAPCQKDTGFFFLPLATAKLLIRGNKCAEMDVLLDLWTSTVYCDPSVIGSEIAPMVYMDRSSRSALVSYSELSARWGISKAAVCRYLRHLGEMGFISTVSFSGKVGTIISPYSYLSTMFAIPDIPLDREKLALIYAPHSPNQTTRVSACVSESRYFPEKANSAFSYVELDFIRSVCVRAVYKLSMLYDCKEEGISIEIFVLPKI